MGFCLGLRGYLAGPRVTVNIVIVIVGKQFASHALKIYITPERMRNSYDKQTYINAIKK